MTRNNLLFMLPTHRHTNLAPDKHGRLLADGLEVVFSAEQALVKVLPSLAKAALSKELTSTFDLYAAQTEEHIARLDRIFKMIDQMPGQRPTVLDKLLKETGHDAASHDLKLIRTAQKIVRYQITLYRSLWKLAQASDFVEIPDLLKNIINQEEERQHILVKLQKTHQDTS